VGRSCGNPDFNPITHGHRYPLRQIERYIFVRIVNATALGFLALGAMVWLSQALRQFDLVASKGQSIWTFVTVSVAMVPSLFAIVLPIALMIAVIYAFTSLNSDSELVVINSSGASQAVVLRPALAAGFLAMLAMASMSLHFSPMSARSVQDLLTNVRSDILSTVMQEGEFMKLTPELTFHMRERGRDGSLRGIFLSDTRDDRENTTYLAERGQLIENPLGTFLIMTNGTIQQRDTTDETISIIQFSSYAFDLSSFASSADDTRRKRSAREQSVAYLLNPDPDDAYRRENPDRFRIEIHRRLSLPLYGLALAVLPLLFLGQAESNRQNRTPGIVAAVLVTLGVEIVGITLPGIAQSSTIAFVAMYALPLGSALIGAILVLRGVQFRPPDVLVNAIGALFSRLAGSMRRRRPAAAT